MNKPNIDYQPRELSDGQLLSAIDEILSAERQARAIVAEAEETVKTIRADVASRERELRERSAAALAAERDKIIDRAGKRSAEDRAARIAAAQAEGDRLVKSKQKQISARIDALVKTLGGK